MKPKTKGNPKRRKARANGRQAEPPAVYCAHTEMVDTASLQPHPKNPNTHPPEQLKLLRTVIEKNGWRLPIVRSKRSGFIVKGHARWMVAQAAHWPEVPVDHQDYATEEDELADLVADNKIAELAESDDAAIDRLLSELDGDVDVARFGLLDGGAEDGDEPVLPVEIRPAPTMGFALIGCPIEKFGMVQAFIEKLPAEFVVTTTATDIGSKEQGAGGRRE